MHETIWGVLLPSGLAFAGVTLTAWVSRRKNTGDSQLQFLAVLQAERVTAEARADKAEAKADKEAAAKDRAERRAKRADTLAWRYHQQLLRAGVEPDPVWPTAEQAKVPA